MHARFLFLNAKDHACMQKHVRGHTFDILCWEVTLQRHDIYVLKLAPIM